MSEIPTVWPDAKLEAQMMTDDPITTDRGCHVHALLERVRYLEAEMLRLRRYENAMKAMACQILPTRFTPKQMEAEVENLTRSLLEEK